MQELIVDDLSWDYEAKSAAMRGAQDISHRDPDGAALLVAQLISQEENDDPLYVPPAQIYQPARLYAQMCHYYQGWTPKVIDDMHYRTFFAMVREANYLQEQENKAAQKG